MTASYRHTGLPFSVEVTRSPRRRRTVGGQMSGNVLNVSVPSWMSKADADRAVADMVQRFARRWSTDGIDLPGRARRLAQRHGLPRPSDIAWSDAMRSRWGSCTPKTGVVRISSRLAPYPSWVLDYVIVHELAHILAPEHSPRFWRLVEAYPFAERARGYLIAKSGDAEGDF